MQLKSKVLVRNGMQKEYKFSYQYYESVELLNSDDIELVNKSKEAMNNAYAPYSNFKVGASLRLKNGEIILGNNQENIAYPSGLCAERVALFHAGAMHPKEVIETICVIAKGELISFDSILSPCGACRQVMLESEKRQEHPLRVLLVNQNDSVILVDSAKYFLPFTFGEQL